MQANPVDERVDYRQLSDDYQRIERAIRYLEEHYREQPSLDNVAASVGLSEYHFQRVFTRWVGISPKRFLQFLTKEHAKQVLESSASVLEATYQAGLSGPGRLHDLFVACEAVTPGEYKSRGQGLQITYGFHPSPFGECLLAVTERGVCGLAFAEDGDRRKALADLHVRWRNADLQENPARGVAWIERIFPLRSEQPVPPLHLFLNGTNFQIKVWEALLRIPWGSLVTYEAIAVHLGAPKAARAVGQAVAANPIAVIIPCHRVIHKMGVFGNYHWGSARKKAILGWEMAQGAA
ncbi:MAG: bifunctional helix-turn-helix domain-containing protein/methylated-DNA--[protein]-cysteine S-methyltransferase [Anaerolineales bacterium]|nr:bifunctional helix-turn-helix domain-containing protein/methylated-DNA--[protein]-cysteine S-methyltransferase [Anaerolineales bacterium]